MQIFKNKSSVMPDYHHWATNPLRAKSALPMGSIHIWMLTVQERLMWLLYTMKDNRYIHSFTALWMCITAKIQYIVLRSCTRSEQFAAITFSSWVTTSDINAPFNLQMRQSLDKMHFVYDVFNDHVALQKQSSEINCFARTSDSTMTQKSYK